MEGPAHTLPERAGTETPQFPASTLRLVFMFALGYWLSSRCHYRVRGLETGRNVTFPILQLVSSKPSRIKVPYNNSLTSPT